MPSRPVQSGSSITTNGNSNRNSNWRPDPRPNHEGYCLNGCIPWSTGQGEIVRYLPSTRGFIGAIPNLRCHYVIIIRTPNVTFDDANAQDLYQCAIITTSLWRRRVYWSIGPWENSTTTTRLMTTQIGSISPGEPWHFTENSSVQLAPPVAIPRCCLHRLPWGLNIRVQLIPDDYDRLMREIEARMQTRGNGARRITFS